VTGLRPVGRGAIFRLAAMAALTALTALTAISTGGCSDTPTAPAPIGEPQPPPTPAPPPEPEPPPAPPRLGVTRILAFGDSMTEGTTSAPLSRWTFSLDAGAPRSYPFKLQSMMTARYTDQAIAVFNAGFAGRRAAEDLDRFRSAVSEAAPNVILLLEGANDLNAPLRGEGVNERIDHTVGSLEDMVKSATRQQIPVLLATLPPQRPGGPKAHAAEFLSRYNAELKEMASKKGATIVDVHAQFPMSEVGQDGLHPTESGYQRLAEIWMDALKTRYETAPAGSLAAAEDGDAASGPDALDLPPAGGRD
jgi:lysophospholipase L1-like esterase